METKETTQVQEIINVIDPDMIKCAKCKEWKHIKDYYDAITIILCRECFDNEYVHYNKDYSQKKV